MLASGPPAPRELLEILRPILFHRLPCAKIGLMGTAVSSSSTFHPPLSEPGDPAWAVALLFPPQGQWTEDAYLALEQRNRRLVELSEGRIEVLPRPNPVHQRIAG